MEYRAYFFTNMYLSGIQKGIQSAHCISDMHQKYSNIGKHVPILDCWGMDSKTMIVLNGGYSSHLSELIHEFTDNTLLPWDYFRESEEALNGAITCVGIVLPAYIYETAQLYQSMSENEQSLLLNSNNIRYGDGDYILTECEKWLIKNLGSYRLA